MATTQKTPTSRKSGPADKAVDVTDYDFDNWTQEDEDAALMRINDVKHIIVEDNFVGRFGDGTIVKIPLSLKLDLIDELQTDFDTPIDQFRHLIRTFAGEDIAAELNSRSMIPVAVLSEKFFRCLARAQELHFPEFKASSN